MYKFESATLIYKHTNETAIIQFGDMFRGVMVKSTLERPYDFKIKELDIPIQGAKQDDEWLWNMLVLAMNSSSPIDFYEKLENREAYLAENLFSILTSQSNLI